MSTTARWLSRNLAGVIAVVLIVGMYAISARPLPSAARSAEAAAGYAFEPRSIALPSGYDQQEIRDVNQRYAHIDGWISSVGAGIALNDLDADGLPNDLCVTDPRIDQVVVTPAPDENADRYEPFVVAPDPLPYDADTMAPMGCAPGDFNEDGRMDLLVYYWGRTPVVFLSTGPSDPLSAGDYEPVELVEHDGGTERYAGPQWNTNAVAIDDFDGDGHVDIFVGNYFPDSPVLDAGKDGGVVMNRSLSNAANGGGSYFFRFAEGRGGDEPSVRFDRDDDVLPHDLAHGWLLAATANDVDADGLPELYLANDHGPDGLLHNRSTPGRLNFEKVYGKQDGTVPKSKRMGTDSFKGMGVDFGDLDGNGLYDMFVSNITTPFGIQESNFHFEATADDTDEISEQLADGDGPWTDKSSDYDTAWTGWAWDVKIADFNNDGQQEIAQANGFVKGEVNRWPQLQELAASNDVVIEHPEWWPRVTAGDDIAGNQRMHLYARKDDGTFANISPNVGTDVPVPTRGIAVGDTNGNGQLDFAIARQWDQPAFYRNTAPDAGEHLTLNLIHEGSDDDGAAGSPVVGAQVEVTTGDGRTLLGRVDGGSGHSGKRSTDVHIGLGDQSGPVDVQLRWRDRDGTVQHDEVELTPGTHTLRLGSQVEEK